MPECYCERDDDNQCPVCRTRLSTLVSEIVAIQAESARKIEKARQKYETGCGGCAIEYADLAVAKVIRETFPNLPDAKSAQGLFSWMTSLLVGMGAISMALSIKAYRDVCAEKGWETGA